MISVDGQGGVAPSRHVEKIDHPEDMVFGDFRELRWTQAFDAMHQTLAREYPFTAWRGIDWPSLRERFQASVVEAETSRDAEIFYRAVRDYVHSIPDGHMDISPKRFGRLGTETYGAFGFEAARLDDGRVIAYAIHPGGAGAKAGMAPGAELVSRDGRPVAQFIGPHFTLGSRGVIATQASRELEQIEQLARAAVGVSSVFEFRNPDDVAVRRSSLGALDDHGAGRPIVRLTRVIPNPEKKLVVHRILPSGVGYIALFAEMPEMVDEFRQALAGMTAAKVPGLIMDLRLNRGGEDGAAAAICGSFVSERRLYQCCQYGNPATGTFDIADAETLYVEPQPPHFDGRVIVLIGRRTVSSGEGIAFQLSHEPNVRTLGFEATAGSFGEAGGVIKLPNKIEVNFPFGACVDEQGRVLIDSDAHGNGGVEPQIKVPRTFEKMLKFGRGIDVELEAADSELADRAAAR